MTIIHPSLNLGFAAEQAARLAAADRAGAESVAERLRQTTQGSPFAVGTTVTARYRYKVAADGSFIPLQTQITTDAAGDDLAVGEEGRAGRQRRERAYSFTDFAFPKPQLSPFDEAMIFSSRAASMPDVVFGSDALGVASAEAQDEAGNAVQVEVITPRPEARASQEKSEFSAAFRRAQFSVALLYARSGALEPTRDVSLAA